VNSIGRDYHFATCDAAERDVWMTTILAISNTQSALRRDVVELALVQQILKFFQDKPLLDVNSPPWFTDFSAHLTAISEQTIVDVMDDANPVRKFLSGRLHQSASIENCQRLISLCLQQLIMPAVLPALLVQLGYPHGQFESITDHFASRCRLLLAHPNFVESLNLPSRECSFDVGIKLTSKLPLLTDPHALLTSICSIIESAQCDLKLLLGPNAPVLTGDHIFCMFLFFIIKAAPAPHHLLCEVASQLNTSFDLEGSRGYIAATYFAAVSYIMSFSSSLQGNTDAQFVVAANRLRHAPSKRFTKRLALVSKGKKEHASDAVEVLPHRPLSAPAAVSYEAVLCAAELDVSSSDDEILPPEAALDHL
jgi:hypothetical protein